jgi:hypothetical protein
MPVLRGEDNGIVACHGRVLAAHSWANRRSEVRLWLCRNWLPKSKVGDVLTCFEGLVPPARHVALHLALQNEAIAAILRQSISASSTENCTGLEPEFRRANGLIPGCKPAGAHFRTIWRLRVATQALCSGVNFGASPEASCFASAIPCSAASCNNATACR